MIATNLCFAQSETQNGDVIMLEKMGDFFDNRLSEYDNHQMTCIDSAKEFYLFTARCLPAGAKSRILDLGAVQDWS